MRTCASTAAVAAASFADAARRPSAWLAAAGCSAGLMAASLALPVSDPADLPRVAASFSGGVLFLMSGAAGVAVPAAMAFSRRQEGFEAAGRAVQGGRLAVHAGIFASAAMAVAVAWAIFAAAQWACISAACAATPAGATALRPSMEFTPREPEGQVEIRPGGVARFVFAPMNPKYLDGGSAECEIDPWLLLARPDGDAAGSPVRVRVWSRGVVVDERDFSSARKGYLVFSVAEDVAVAGFEIEVMPGPSPFDLVVKKGGVVVRGARASFTRNFALSAASALAFALLLAAFSSLGSSFLSLPVAVTFAAGLGLAAFLAPPAAESLEFLERAGLAEARNSYDSASSWLPAFENFTSALMAVLPDAWRINRSDFLASGRQIPPAEVAVDFGKCMAAGAAAVIATLVFNARSETKSE